MEDVLQRIIDNLIARLSGPLRLRFVIQPFMAAVFAVIDGLKDAREGRPPYFWALFYDPAHRRKLLRQGWKSIGKIFILALVLDAVYQWITLRRIYPGESLLTAAALAIIPYIFVRGPVNRIARAVSGKQS